MSKHEDYRLKITVQLDKDLKMFYKNKPYKGLRKTYR